MPKGPSCATGAGVAACCRPALDAGPASTVATDAATNHFLTAPRTLAPASTPRLARNHHSEQRWPRKNISGTGGSLPTRKSPEHVQQILPRDRLVRPRPLPPQPEVGGLRDVGRRALTAPVAHQSAVAV